VTRVPHDLFVRYTVAIGGRHEAGAQAVRADRLRQAAFQPSLCGTQAAKGKPVATAKAPASPSAAKKPIAKAAPKKTADTVTLKTVFEQLAAAHELPKKLGQSLLTDFVAGVTKILQNGDRLRMSGLGIIEVKDRPARMGRNPATGAAVQIAASKKVAFRAAKELKAAV
jgi:DNA-binding protein HU-beta